MCSITVSVIIPVYNAERHLEECLESCVTQTLRQIEIICINDGSTDSSGEILKKYAKKYSNIVVLNQKNQGSGVARNLGIKHANGEFVAFMDSDDYYPEKDALKKLYDVAVEKKVLACGGSALFLNDGKVNKSDTGMCFQENRVMYYKEYQSTGGFTQFIYNIRFLKESNIIFPAYRRYQDPPFFVELMTKIDKFCVISDWVYVIRRTDKLIPYNNPDIMVDILNGIRDILKISRMNQFEVLHTNMVINLMDSYIAFVYKLIYNEKGNVRKGYETVLAEIDATLLEQDNRKIKKPQAMSDDQINQVVNQSLERERLLLNRINAYEKVLIYGAGMVGRMFYNYLLQKECHVDIEFMVSTENPDYTACGKKVKSICECVDAKEDALVIIANKNHIGQMEETAHNYEFKNIETISYNEIMLFGADMIK